MTSLSALFSPRSIAIVGASEDPARPGNETLRALTTLGYRGGARGLPALDIDALAEALVRVSEFAWTHRGQLCELDINPLFVRPLGHAVLAADALIVTRSDQPKENA